MTRVRAICSDKLDRITALLGSAAQATFNADIAVVRRVDTPDLSGGFTIVWSTVHTYRGTFMPSQVRAAERERDVRVQNVTLWKFTFALGADIVVTDRLQVDGRTFEVISAGEGSWSTSHVVNALEII